MPKPEVTPPKFKRVTFSLAREVRKRLKKLKNKHGVDRDMMITALIMAAKVE